MKTMKKFFFAAGVIVLQVLNIDVLSWAVLMIVATAVLVKVFPTLMEGTK